MAGDCKQISLRQEENNTKEFALRYAVSVIPLESFSEMLKKALLKSGLSQREFAKKCGISQGFPPLLLNGKRTPPLDKLEEIMRAVGITDQDRQAFTQAAHLAHAPGEVRGLVNSLRLESAKSRQETSDLRAQVADLTAQLGTSKAQIAALNRDFRSLLSVVRERGLKLPKGVSDV
jgi:transcriptional regulator with XRE-family HTH domain